MLSLVAASCGSVTDVLDEPGWTIAPAFSTLSVADLRPAGEWDAIDLLWYENGETSVVSSQGTMCGAAVSPAACDEALADIASFGRFGPSCLPADCGSLLVLNRADEIVVARNAGSLREVLGPIDTATEALFLLSAAGYRWSGRALENGAIRPTPDGWQFVGRITVADCDPFVVEAHRVAVGTDGSIRVEAREEISRDNSCA